MRLGVVGSRSFEDRPLFWKHLNAWLRRYPDLHVVSGGAPAGADKLAELWCRQKGVPITIYHAKWTRKDGSKDRGAGMARNTDIAQNVEELLAFWDKVSHGTPDTCYKCIAIGRPVWVVTPDGEAWEGDMIFR